jgi:adenylate cyclase
MDKAIELLGPYFDRVSVSELKHCSVDPDIDPLREDPRFTAMVDSASLRLGVGGEPALAAAPPDASLSPA